MDLHTLTSVEIVLEVQPLMKIIIVEVHHAKKIGHKIVMEFVMV